MDVEVTGLVRQYTPLLAQLDRSWDVLPFPYDWRLPIADERRVIWPHDLEDKGVAIGGDRPVHFVGHSMGGLVARAFLIQHHAEWARGTGRFVQLGTPNWGSFAMPLAVWGEERARPGAGAGRRLPRRGGDPGHDRLLPRRARAVPLARTPPPRHHGGRTLAALPAGGLGEAEVLRLHDRSVRCARVPRSQQGRQGGPHGLRGRRQPDHAVPRPGGQRQPAQLRRDEKGRRPRSPLLRPRGPLRAERLLRRLGPRCAHQRSWRPRRARRPAGDRRDRAAP